MKNGECVLFSVLFWRLCDRGVWDELWNCGWVYWCWYIWDCFFVKYDGSFEFGSVGLDIIWKKGCFVGGLLFKYFVLDRVSNLDVIYEGGVFWYCCFGVWI